MPSLLVLSSLVIERLRQRSQNGTLQHQARRQPEAGGIEEPQQAVVGQIGLRLQRLHPLPTHDLDEAGHQCMANAVLPAIMLNTDRVERGNGLFTAEFPTQDTGEGKTDQRAFAHNANMHEIFRVLLGVGQPFLEKRRRGSPTCAESMAMTRSRSVERNGRTLLSVLAAALLMQEPHTFST